MRQPAEEPMLMSRKRAAAAISVCTRTIDSAIRRKELKAWRVGSRVLIERSALLRFARRKRA
jgi:excisionase family DNA binding protein